MKKLSLYCLLAAMAAPLHAAGGGGQHIVDDGHLDRQAREPYRAVPPQEKEPREPSEFVYGEYHRSSKMTPAGSEGPGTWVEEGSVELPEGARPAPTIGEAARERERKGEVKRESKREQAREERAARSERSVQ